MRDQFKCSECRRKKIKCEPRSRDWETTHQKCNNCKKHVETPCGPSRKKQDDPGNSGLRNGVSAHEEHSIRDAEDRPRAPAPLLSRTVHSTESIGEHRGQEPSLAGREPNSNKKRESVSDEPDELRKDANSRLKNLNSMGISYAFGSDVAPVHCRNRDNLEIYNKQTENDRKVISDKFHSQFIEVCRRGIQLHELGMDIDADRVFMKLMMALRTYRGLCDDRKKGALRRIAKFFLDTGDQYEHERVLIMVTEADDIPGHQEDLCLRLADSLIETSKIAHHDLLEHWDKHFMDAGELSVALPPIQRSAQHKNPGVTLRMMKERPHSIANTPPALIERGALHIAATHGCEKNLKNLLDVGGAQVDSLDLHKHTALFLAAAKGHEGCCAELIKCGARVDVRDIHGTTVLEAAAGAGHFQIVQRLVEAGADVNPLFVCCESSPLQAAIENPESPLEIAFYLLGQNGDVSIPRKDGKNAIDLAAERRGCAVLTEMMRQKQQQPSPSFFGQPFSLDQQFLGSVPDLNLPVVQNTAINQDVAHTLLSDDREPLEDLLERRVPPFLFNPYFELDE